MIYCEGISFLQKVLPRHRGRTFSLNLSFYLRIRQNTFRCKNTFGCENTFPSGGYLHTKELLYYGRHLCHFTHRIVKHLRIANLFDCLRHFDIPDSAKFIHKLEI